MGAFLINNPKCVFIHIPKVAGASIRRGIFQENYVGPVFDKLPSGWENLFKFCFVRNPYDRIISAWKMFTTGMENSKWGYQQKNLLPNLSFEDFLNIATNNQIDFAKRTGYNSIIRHHTIPQTHSYHCFPYADFIGRFESLDDDFKVIAKKINLPKVNFPHWNKTDRKSYKHYYTEKTYATVTNYYKDDIKKLNYSF